MNTITISPGYHNMLPVVNLQPKAAQIGLRKIAGKLIIFLLALIHISVTQAVIVPTNGQEITSNVDVFGKQTPVEAFEDTSTGKIENNKAQTTLDSDLYIQETFSERFNQTINDILSQFDKVETGLQNARVIFGENDLGQTNGKIRKSRSTARKPPVVQNLQCDISRDELTEINNEINVALNGNRTLQGVRCTLNTNNSNNCEELFKSLQCGVNHLRTSLTDVVADKASSKEISILLLRNNQERFLKILYERLDNIKRTLTQEYQSKLNEITIAAHNLERALKNMPQRIQELENTQTNAFEHDCILSIKNGNIGDAFLNYNRHKDKINISRIITTVYTDYGKLRQLNNISKFTKTLSCIDGMKVADAIVDIIKRNNHYGDPEIAYCFDAMKACPRNLDILNIPKMETDFISRMANDILTSSNRNKITSFIKTLKKTPDCFTDLYPKIIKTVYNNSFGLYSILNFILEINWLDDKIVLFDSLLKEMKEANHLNSTELVTVAYYVWKTMDDNKNTISDNASLNGAYNNLKNKFPSSVRALLWDDFIIIESREHVGYTLYGSNESKFFYSAGFLYIYPDNYYVGGYNQKWKVFKYAEYGKIYFTFQNKQNFRYVQASSSGTAYSCRYSQFSDVGTDCSEDKSVKYWEVIPTGIEDYVYFKNKKNGRVLHAGDKKGGSSNVGASERFYDWEYKQQWKIR